MHKKRGRGRGRASGEGIEHDSLLQPCCIEGCDRYGTRLLSSLRDNYQLKDDHSGRVCEGHYRRDLRSFKRKHSNNVSSSTLKKFSIMHNPRKHHSSTSSVAKVLDEPAHDYYSFSYKELDDKNDEEVNNGITFQDKSHQKLYPNTIMTSHKLRSDPFDSIKYCHQQKFSTEKTEFGEDNEEDENDQEIGYESNSATTLSAMPSNKWNTNSSDNSQIFMEVDECEYEDFDDDDEEDDMTTEEIPSHENQRIPVLPSISQFYNTSGSDQYNDRKPDSYYPAALHLNHCGQLYAPSPVIDTKFKQFCEFILRSESVI